MKNTLPTSAVISLMLCCALLQAQSSPNAAETPSFFDYLYDQKDSIPVLQLETNWTGLIRKKMDMQYQEAILGFSNNEGRSATLNVKLKARGNMRKQVCYFPPVRIKLPKTQLGELGFSPFNDLKMVLQCRSSSREQEWLMKEWLIYQLYECISPASLRAKLIRLQCKQKNREDVQLYAFVLEYEDEMALRLGARVVKQGIVRLSGLERTAYLKMCFFQYMIANTDWSIPNRHNLEFIMTPQYPGIIAIPYDFDYSGLIHTSYAVPYEALPIKNVTDRYFQGQNVTSEEAAETARFFLSKKADIMQRCESFEHIEDKSKKLMLKFVSDFFSLLEDEKKMKRVFVTN